MVAAIHTPSSAAFFAFDKLLLLDAGRLCYLGAVSETVRFFSEAGFQCPTYHNPADFVIETLSSSDDAPAKLKRQHRIWSGREVMQFGLNRRSGVPAVVVVDSAGGEVAFMAAERDGASALKSYRSDWRRWPVELADEL